MFWDFEEFRFFCCWFDCAPDPSCLFLITFTMLMLFSGLPLWLLYEWAAFVLKLRMFWAWLFSWSEWLNWPLLLIIFIFFCKFLLSATLVLLLLKFLLLLLYYSICSWGLSRNLSIWLCRWCSIESYLLCTPEEFMDSWPLPVLFWPATYTLGWDPEEPELGALISLWLPLLVSFMFLLLMYSISTSSSSLLLPLPSSMIIPNLSSLSKLPELSKSPLRLLL